MFSIGTELSRVGFVHFTCKFLTTSDLSEEVKQALTSRLDMQTILYAWPVSFARRSHLPVFFSSHKFVCTASLCICILFCLVISHSPG